MVHAALERREDMRCALGRTWPRVISAGGDFATDCVCETVRSRCLLTLFTVLTLVLSTWRYIALSFAPRVLRSKEGSFTFYRFWRIGHFFAGAEVYRMSLEHLECGR